MPFGRRNGASADAGPEAKLAEIVASARKANEQGYFKDVIAIAGDLLRQGATLPALWEEYAWALYGQERYKDAADACHEALARSPENGALWLTLTLALMALDRKGEELAASERAVEYAPGDARAWYLRGLALTRAKRHDEALAAHYMAVQRRPDDLVFVKAWAEAYNQLHLYEGALAAYEGALALAPKDVDLWLDKAWALYHLSRYPAVTSVYLDQFSARLLWPRTLCGGAGGAGSCRDVEGRAHHGGHAQGTRAHCAGTLRRGAYGARPRGRHARRWRGVSRGA